MFISEITKPEFVEISGAELAPGTPESVVIRWLATDDRTTVGAIRQDSDANGVSFSWASFRKAPAGFWMTGIGSAQHTVDAALRQLKACMARTDTIPTPTDEEFAQVVAEAAQELGHERVEDYMIGVVNVVGWPIPKAAQVGVLANLCHLVCVAKQDRADSLPDGVESISKDEFIRLVGHLISPTAVTYTREIGWFAASDRSRVGVLIKERIDHDYAWVFFVLRPAGYETTDIAVSLPTREVALQQLADRIAR